MATVNIPTSRDIFIEVEGKKIAVVQEYVVETSRETYQVEAFGSDVPVATIGGKFTHLIKLKKVVPVKSGEQVDFYGLSGFTLMIVKPDCRIVYSGCEWRSISEAVGLNSPCMETVTLVSAKRTVL